MPTILESELEDYLFECKEDIPIPVSGKCYRQVNIKGYGIIDLLYIDITPGDKLPCLDITIVELKKDYVDLSALGQICRYKNAISRFFSESCNDKHYEFERVNISGILIGKEYASGDVCYAVDQIDWLSCYHYNLSLHSGIELEESSEWYNEEEDLGSFNKIIDGCNDTYLKVKKYLEGEK